MNTEKTPTVVERFTWEKLRIVVKEHRTKVPTSRVGVFAGVHVNLGWLTWHELTLDPDFLAKGWARSTPVVYQGKPSIWVPALKAIITLIPEVAPPRIVVEPTPVAEL